MMGAGKREAEQMEKKQEKKQKTAIVFEISKDVDFDQLPTYYEGAIDWNEMINGLNLEESITIAKHEIKDFTVAKKIEINIDTVDAKGVAKALIEKLETSEKEENGK